MIKLQWGKYAVMDILQLSDVFVKDMVSLSRGGWKKIIMRSLLVLNALKSIDPEIAP